MAEPFRRDKTQFQASAVSATSLTERRPSLDDLCPTEFSRRTNLPSGWRLIFDDFR